MISGFNTDVRSGDVVYHVQTEDKGDKSRLIVSLVYDRGTILASKRVTYDDLVNGEFSEAALAEGVQRQHQLICAAVKAGRVGELKEMTAKARSKSSANAAVSPVSVVAAEPSQVSVAVADVPNVVLAPPTVPPVDNPPAAAPPPPAHIQFDQTYAPPVAGIFDDAPLFDGVSIIEDEILPAEAVEVVSELSGVERPAHSKLGIELLGEAKFRGGDRRNVTMMVCRGTDRKVVPGAEIMIKVLGSSFRPVIFHARSDANGLAKIHLQLPHFDAGRAALLVRAINDGEEVELRRIVTPG